MDSIRFSAANQSTFRPEVLNHKTASPFQQNQIQFHIGSDYLSDFTEKGIEEFIKKHQPDGKDLDIKEVKAFIQRVANNAEASKNVTFDLADPQIGLYEDDGIEKRHLEAGFTLSVSEKSLLPKGQATTVKFVDVTSASFDLKEKETEISAHQKTIKETQGQLKELREEHTDTKDDLDTARRILGPDAENKLQHILERQPQITKELEQLDKDEANYKAELAKPDLKPERKTELERILRALPVERKQLQDENKKLSEQLNDKTGPLLQRTSLNDLHQLKQKVAAQTQKIGELEAKIQDELAKIKTIMDRPSPDAKPTDAPNPAAKTDATPTTPKPEQTGDGGDPNPAEESITVGGSVKFEDLKSQSPAHQASRLASLPAAQQKELLAQFSPDERAKILSETETSITRLQAEASSSRRDRQLEAYQTLRSSIQQINAPTSPTKPADAPAPASSNTSTTTTSTTSTTTTSSSTTTASSGVTLGSASATLATGTITRKGQPFMHGGQAVTLESFKSLAMEAKFDILMKADSAFLRDLLTAMTKEERSQIKNMAQRVIDDFVRDYGSQVTVVNVTQSVDATISGTATTGATGTKPTPSPEARERYERAQEIIRIINELDGTSSSTQTTQTTQTSQTTTVRGRTLKEGEFVYRVKPGDTATSIAKSQLGNEMYNYDIFNEDRNQGLNQAMIQRKGPQVNRYNEDISQYKEYQELVLSRTPAPPPPRSVAPRKEEPQNPVVNEEAAPVTPTPAPKVVESPAPQPVVTPEVQPKIVVTEEEPAPAPAKVETPVAPVPAKDETPAPAKVETPVPPAPAQPKRKTS